MQEKLIQAIGTIKIELIVITERTDFYAAQYYKLAACGSADAGITVYSKILS